MNLPGTRLFSILWAFALVTTLNGDIPGHYSVAYCTGHFITASLGLAILCRPAARRLVTLSAASFLVVAWSQLPALPNHRVILGLISFLILASSLASSKRDTSAWSALQHALRALTLIVYAFAVLAKLNTTYTSSRSSCAYVFFDQALSITGLPSGASSLLSVPSIAWWSIVSEVLIAFLLICKRTRPAGIVLGLLFHLALAANYLKYFANFSCTMFVLLCSWLSDEQAEGILHRYETFWRRIVPALGFAMFIVTACAWSGVIEMSAWIIVRHVLFSVFGITVLTSVIAVARVPNDRALTFSPRSLSIAQAVVLLVALANGAAPYLGIKTRSSFSMYSNLRIEPHVSNHFFMPPSPDILGVLQDTVQITSESTDPQRTTFPPETPLLVTYLELCCRIAQKIEDKTPFEVSFIRGGAQRALRSGEPLPADCPPRWARKLLLFGPVGPGSENSCVW